MQNNQRNGECDLECKHPAEQEDVQLVADEDGNVLEACAECRSEWGAHLVEVQV